MREEILRIIARECGLAALPALSAPIASLESDSIDLICAVSALEERFELELPLDSAETDMETVGDIVGMVERLAARGGDVSRERLPAP